MDASDFECDEQGYLLDSTAWTTRFAEIAAAAEGLVLSADHWAVVEFLRDYHARFGLSPPMRVLVKAIAPLLGEARASSRRLYQLFPDGPAKQACKVAGLPKPEHCL
ncbi:MAG: TusE/DsrC/DsvC family sulfur relay protein [Lysobacterales bacterium]|nr:TusE/DsrC/DsvC family sulfur relay protein [Xanthomonadales bacterium]MCB1612125.1 TusE/DsrC/DsvC family sulfur relay protein [Xanthomonadales bacterium]MCP5476690.1 TusE/DsrC/DsvC family sulfur relay protein [Rhodanobacteraceae bacterium]